MVVSDIVLERPLPEAVAKDVLAWVGCVAGAAQRADYFRMVEAAGLSDVTLLAEADSLADLAEVAPEEAKAIVERSGVPREALLGIVRSVTWRAVKR